MRKLQLLIAAAALFGASSAFAATSATVGPLAISGNVPALCAGGSVSGGDSTFGLGVLIDTATGLMRTDLSAPNKAVVGSFCNAQSTITVTASPMTAQTFTGTPPSGFTNGVNFTATASGWTTTAASTTTGAGSNPAATQTRTTAFSGDITVGISGFAPVGGALRLLADPTYRGTVTITLAVAP
jgi:hypothetical protein